VDGGGDSGTAAQRVFQVNRTAVFLEQVAKGLVGKLLKILHLIVAEQIQLLPSFFVDLYAFSRHGLPFISMFRNDGSLPARGTCGRARILHPSVLPRKYEKRWRRIVRLSGAAVELAGLTEAPEIIRHHRSDRIGDDAKAFDGAALCMRIGGNDVIGLEHVDLIRRQRRIG
jgi:hypothetical protein